MTNRRVAPNDPDHSENGTPTESPSVRRASTRVQYKKLTSHQASLVLMTELIRKRRNPSQLPVCKTPLSDITKPDLIKCARGFLFLVKKHTEEEALNLLIHHYPCMNSLMEENPEEFKSLLEIASTFLLRNAKRYANFRLFFGALLSTFDMGTDLFMVFVFFSSNQNNYAWATLSTIFFNLFMQILITFFQNRKKPLKVILKEMILVVTILKPGVDTYRVVSDLEQEKDSLFDFKTEWAFMKGAELFTEAIPGALIQCYAYLNGTDQGKAALFSLISSVVTAAFTSTIISYDMDMDQLSRKAFPKFFGYMPSDTKMKVYTTGCMFFISGGQLILKCFACSLCAISSPIFLVGFLFAEVLLFMLYKVAMKDMRYWLPIYGAQSWIMSFAIRLVIKIVIDFTSCLQFRHPSEMGGAYFAFNYFLTPFTALYMASRYLDYVEVEENRERLTLVLTPEAVYTFIFVVWSVQLITVGFFFRSIPPEYVKTFYSLKTGWQFSLDTFNDNGHDEENGEPSRDEFRIMVFCDNKHRWASIEPEIRSWVNSSIPVWNETQPEWWNDQKRSLIPDWIIDDPALLLSIRGKGVQELQRRGSWAPGPAVEDSSSGGVTKKI
ncbi:hypothetical protein TrST_g4717 [Triparma strigata]|uniref:Uncharacterized protein n=1 Tax=Triparma strigata TaxID=1606541 RepID=A0A9W7AQ79_9STRA|nr:hypothetical protein TrST_g4717 [Triparma strigata]